MMCLVFYIVSYLTFPTSSIVPSAPGPPTITAATPVSPTSINVTWTQSSPTDMISGYGISYSPVRRDCPQIESGQQVVDGGAVSQYTVSGLQEGVEYDITVQARGVQAFGTVSNSLRAVSLNAGNKSCDISIKCQ